MFNSRTSGGNSSAKRAAGALASIRASYPNGYTKTSPPYLGSAGLFGEIPIYSTDSTAKQFMSNKPYGAQSIQERIKNAGGILPAAKDQISRTSAALGLSSEGNGSSASAAGGTVSAAGAGDYLGNGQTVNYLNADLAAAYGMDRDTAYQEALSNTSYQRAVKDMQNSGLNPAVLFGAGAGSGASGVSYISPSSSGTSSGASVGTSSAKSSHHMYKLLSNVGDLIGFVTGHPSIGYAARALGNLLDGNL